MHVRTWPVATAMLVVLSFFGCGGMKVSAIYRAAAAESWRCPRDYTSIQDFGHRRFRLMGCGWLSDYDCVTLSQVGANGAVMSHTSCRALAPPVPLNYGPPSGPMQQPMMPSPPASVDAGSND